MALQRTTYRPAAVATAFLFGVAAMTTPARQARAESPDVSPDGKGIVGGALLGAEVVTITEGPREGTSSNKRVTMDGCPSTCWLAVWRSSSRPSSSF
jgi:hypothetical protein